MLWGLDGTRLPVPLNLQPSCRIRRIRRQVQTRQTRTNELQLTAPHRHEMGVKPEYSITLLQLRDGSMYGFTGYWVKDGELHYKTTYGGENSLRFERIDFAKTVQLNADRDVPFVLPPSSAAARVRVLTSWTIDSALKPLR